MLNIFVQVCQTLSYTHACGVIHHDIKPANIMVGAFGEVHLMDWGLARISTDLCAPIHRPRDVDSLVAEYAQQQVLPNKSSRDRAVDLPAGAVWGTPAYMSPEQSRGQIADLRTDVFGLGGILCEILTGSPPYAGKSFLDVCLKATRADLEQAYSGLIDSGATGVLVRLAMNCITPDPDDREQTIAGMSQLRRGQPVVQFQNRYSVADGTWRWFEWTAKSVPADNIIFAVARDVTNRMR